MRELAAGGLRQVGPPQTSIDPTAIICGSIHLDCQCDILDIRRPDVCSVNPGASYHLTRASSLVSFDCLFNLVNTVVLVNRYYL